MNTIKITDSTVRDVIEKVLGDYVVVPILEINWSHPPHLAFGNYSVGSAHNVYSPGFVLCHIASGIRIQRNEEDLLENAKVVCRAMKVLLPYLESTEVDVKKKQGDCDSCRSQNVEVGEYRQQWPVGSNKTKWLCDLCAGTVAGVWMEYPDQHDHENIEIMRTINYVGNALLGRIGRK